MTLPRARAAALLLAVVAFGGACSTSSTGTGSEPTFGAAAAGGEASSPHGPGATRPTPAGTTVPTDLASRCRHGAPLANVYHDYRLMVVRSCAVAAGYVTRVYHEADGDFHIDIRLDSRFASLANDANRRDNKGDLVAEVVPADEAGCVPGAPPRPASGSYDYGICTGAGLVAPGRGQHVVVVGPYVIDGVHDWAEIHPAWWLSTDPTAQAAGPPATSAGPATAVDITSLTNPARRGSAFTVKAQTQPGVGCTVAVVLPSGRHSTASGLEPARADAEGRVSWTMHMSTQARPGDGSVLVQCGRATAQAAYRLA